MSQKISKLSQAISNNSVLSNSMRQSRLALEQRILEQGLSFDNGLSMQMHIQDQGDYRLSSIETKKLAENIMSSNEVAEELENLSNE